jgi:anti-sigma-K factor RskA
MMCSSCDARHAEGVIPVGGPHEDEGFRARSAARRSKAEDDSALTSMGGSPVSDSTGPVGSKAEDDSALTSMGGSPVSDSTGPVEVVRRLLVMEGPVEYFGGRDTMLASGVDVPC